MSDSDRYRIREVFAIAELKQVCDVAQLVWGPDEEVDNTHLLRAIQDEGGLILAAESAPGEFVGMLFAFPTSDATWQHSHRMGVVAEWRRFGIAEALKLAQRDWCLARGITGVRWTFDPLRATNARLNIHRLGATANRYMENHYGEESTDDALVMTDRLMVDWALDRGDRSTSSEHRYVAIPNDIAGMRVADPEEAMTWQNHYRTTLPGLFAAGWTITDVIATPARDTSSAYQLTRIV